MPNEGDSGDSSVQLYGHQQFSGADVLSLSMFLGDSGIPSGMCEVFEGKLHIPNFSSPCILRGLWYVTV